MKAHGGERLNMQHKPYGLYERFIKRPLDFTLSLIALIILSPIILVLIITGAIAMEGNPFFVQERPGCVDKRTGKEKIFSLIKFRTMSNVKDKNGNLLPDEVRLNKYGKFLRSTSLDELPELINILIGDMAIVGPRPLLIRYLERYTPTQRRRQEVRPGLTGLAMSTVRNSAGWDTKFKLDVEYVDKVSFLLDAKIIFWTIKIVLKREGINEPGEVTNSEFMGVLEEKR